MTRERFLINGALNFTVSKVPLHTYNTRYIDDYNKTSFFATVNDLTGEALGSVKGAYTVMQNKDLLDLVLDKMGDGNYDLEDSDCGTFDKGRKVYMFIRYKKMDADWGQEAANCYVYALSSHDGSQRLTFGIANKIHSCSNMFGLLMNDKENNHIAKHFSGAKERAAVSLEPLIESNVKGLASLMRTMQEHDISVNDKFVSDVLDLIADSNTKRKTMKWKERRESALLSIHDEMQEKGNTYYGLFNGVTNYLTHKANLRLVHNLTGKGSKISNKALQMIVKQMRETGCLN